MQLKDYLSYIISVPVLLYSVFEGFAIYEGVSTLQTNYPTCFKSNENRGYVFFGTMLIFLMTATSIENGAEALFNRVLPQEKFPLDSKVRSTKAKVMAERLYRFIVYSIFTTAAFCIMSNGSYLTYLMLGSNKSPKYYENYPC